MAREIFLHYFSIVRGIHWSPEESPNKGPTKYTFDDFFVDIMNKLFNSLFSGDFGLPFCTSDVAVMYAHLFSRILIKSLKVSLYTYSVGEYIFGRCFLHSAKYDQYVLRLET